MSLVVPIWGYFAAVMMADAPAAGMGPVAVSVLVLVSQIFGFQGILTVYWIPLVVNRRGWALTSSPLRAGVAAAVFWTVALQALAGSVILAVNVENGWWYQRSQVVFQVRRRGNREEGNRKPSSAFPNLKLFLTNAFTC